MDVWPLTSVTRQCICSDCRWKSDRGKNQFKCIHKILFSNPPPPPPPPPPHYREFSKGLIRRSTWFWPRVMRESTPQEPVWRKCSWVSTSSEETTCELGACERRGGGGGGVRQRESGNIINSESKSVSMQNLSRIKWTKSRFVVGFSPFTLTGVSEFLPAQWWGV